MSEAAELSKMLFEAREQAEMWADVAENQTGQPATAVRRLIIEIDAYRARQGWSPHGFGGETDRQPLPAHLRDDAPFQTCTKCGRHTRATDQSGQTCGMLQPDSSRCTGRFDG